MGRRRHCLQTGAQSGSLVRGTEPRPEEVAVNRAGQGARDQSLVQTSPKPALWPGRRQAEEAASSGSLEPPLSPSCPLPSETGDSPSDPFPGEPQSAPAHPH